MKNMMPMMLLMLVIVVFAVIFTVQGTNMHKQVFVQEAQLHSLQESYFNISKVERDAAPTGSELNQQLVEIQKAPSTLLTLKLVGVGKILAGIFALLLGILVALIAMPVRLSKLLQTIDRDIKQRSS